MDNGSEEIRNIFLENELMSYIFNSHKRERMVELCGEDWVLEQESKGETKRGVNNEF